MNPFDYLIDCIILYVVVSLLIGQFLMSHAAGYELKNGPKFTHVLALLPYFFWASFWWPKIIYKLIKREYW
jgi:hypothetical protein